MEDRTVLLTTSHPHHYYYSVDSSVCVDGRDQEL